MAISVNGIYVPRSFFPGGEVHTQLPWTQINQRDHQNCYDISLKFRSSDDLIQLLMVTDVIRRHSPDASISLICIYFPYSRQDKIFKFGESLSLKVISNLINSLNFKQVITYDLHSDVSGALINNCINISQDSIIGSLCISKIKDLIDDELYILFPDSGASKKSKSVMNALNLPMDRAIHCIKTRNEDSLSIIIHEHHKVKNKNILIVDDICDGGATFIECAKALIGHGANGLFLYVTHGIFSNGKEELNKYFRGIFCFDDWTEE